MNVLSINNRNGFGQRGRRQKAGDNEKWIAETEESPANTERAGEIRTVAPARFDVASMLVLMDK